MCMCYMHVQVTLEGLSLSGRRLKLKGTCLYAIAGAIAVFDVDVVIIFTFFASGRVTAVGPPQRIQPTRRRQGTRPLAPNASLVRIAKGALQLCEHMCVQRLQ